MINNLINNVNNECKPREDREHIESEKGILDVQNLSAWYGKTLAIKISV